MIVTTTEKQRAIIASLQNEAQAIQNRLQLVLSTIVAGQVDVPDGTNVGLTPDGNIEVAEAKEAS